MAVFTLGAPGTLEEVLPIHGVQAWRAAYLITCRGVTAVRSGAPVDFSIDGPKTAMRRGDVVTVPDPEPALCTMPREILARSHFAYRDYAILAKRTDPADTHLPRLAELYDAKGQVVRLQPSSDSLKEFAQMLKHDPKVAFPIRDLHLGTHAGSGGVVTIAAAPGGTSNLNYEALEDAVKNSTFTIDPALLRPRPKDDQNKELPARFVIRGCAVGQADGYLRKFKEALGGGLLVVACKFEHAAGSFSGPAGAGLYEFLAYEFEVHRPSPLGTEQEVIDAFIAAGFKNHRDQPIKKAQWESWIPKGRPPRPFNRPEKLQSRLAGRELVATAFYDVRPGSFPEPDVVVAAKEDPGTDADRTQALKVHLAARPGFKADHPWPLFRRIGYASLDDMLAGFQWKFSHDRKEEKLHCAGKRVTFVVHQPIVDPKEGFVHNFFPTRPQGKPLEMFGDDNPRYFVTI